MSIQGKISEIILDGHPPITVYVYRTAQARRLSLRVSKSNGRVRLSMPRFCDLAQAQKFVHEKQAWIRKNMVNFAPPTPLVLGGLIPFRGDMLTICAAEQRFVSAGQGALWVPAAAGDDIAPYVLAFFKLAARDELSTACAGYAAKLGTEYGRLSLRDTRSRWGSCSQGGNLSFSWRLVMAPPLVLDYVAAHEVAHLKEMNHSKAFWRVVETLCPHYQQHQSWLRENSHQLFSYLS